MRTRGMRLHHAERARRGGGAPPVFVHLCPAIRSPVITSCLLAALACCLLPACASRSQPGTATSATSPAAAPRPPALDLEVADSLTAGVLAVARAAQLGPEDLLSLEVAPPRVLPAGILFTYAGRPARAVFVAGTFNGWVPTQHELARRRAADSLWVGLVPLPARGRYLYKFLIDGRRWVADPANPERGGDGAGGVASVVIVP